MTDTKMAERGLQLDQEKFCCSICLDLLNEPVTTSCGHSFCKSCIKKHWDAEDHRGTHTCPQCRQTFVSRPVLGKNTMLAELVEELNNSGLHAAPHPQHYAGPGDVACDVCSERKLKASKTCLQCVASYCELHLQPHYESSTFQKHKLVTASAKLRENICSHHNKVKEVFCRSDQQCVCYLCAMEEHKDHDTVPAAAERTERQRELGPRWQKLQQRIQDREKDMKLLQQQVEAISDSADKAVRDSQTMFSQLVRLMEKRSSDVQQQIRSQQETELSCARELQKKLQQEITELRRKDAELEQLSRTEDHSQFLLTYPSLSGLSESTQSASIIIHPQSYFEEVTAAVSELTKKLQNILSQDRSESSLTEGKVLHAAGQHTTLMKQQMCLVPPPPPPSLQPPSESKTFVNQQPCLVPPSPPPPPSLQSLEELKTLMKQQLRLVPPPIPSLQSTAEPKTFVNQQTCLVLPADSKILMKHQPRLVLPPPFPPTSLQPPEESKTLLKQQPCLVPPSPPPPTSFQPPEESKAFVKLQPRLVLPPIPLWLPAESKTLPKQPPPVVLPPPSYQPPAEPKTRDEFLQYSQHITLDPNTVNKGLELSEGNRKVTWMNKVQSYPDHADRFSDSFQVLSRESLTGRCYWEVKRTRSVSVAVAYKSISRTGGGSVFGDNDKSWTTYCCLSKYEFKHNSTITFLSGLRSSTVGVYLDHSAGVLSFYSVSETMTLLHRVQTTFTQPLHAGLWVGFGSSAELVELQQSGAVEEQPVTL